MDVLTECSLDGCDRTVRARGMCGAHYQAWKKDHRSEVRQYNLSGRVDKGGYVRLWMPGHPIAQPDGYVLEHRLVMHEAGFDVHGMHVHHRDHDKTNNDLSNLELLTPAQHAEHHGHIPNAGQFRRKTHCARGHEFTPENTYTYGDGRRRECYACKRAKWASGSTRHYSEDVKAAAVADYIAGLGMAEIRAKYGASDGTVVGWARSAGARIRRPGRPASGGAS